MSRGSNLGKITVAAGSGARKIKRYYLLVLSTNRQYCLYSTVVVHTAANEKEVSIRWLKHRVMFYIFYYGALKLSCSLAEYWSCYVDNAQ